MPSPVREPEKVNMVIFRENTEDVYAGIEWPAGYDTSKKVIEFLAGLDKDIRPDSGIGIKPISRQPAPHSRPALRHGLQPR